MEKELLELYLDGMEIDLLASHLNLTSWEIVRKLSELLFDVTPEHDPSARKYRQRWNWVDNSKLWRMYAVGIPIQTIAEKLGRDEMGVCYRLLTEQLVVVPQATVSKYKLDQGDFAIETGHERNVKICSYCLDVIGYCKCYF